MTTITLHTEIAAGLETVFDLSRSVDLHLAAAVDTHEKAISGKTQGLLNLDDWVTWRGKHFGLFLTHTSKIVSFERPFQFTDLMVQGHFTYFVHQHEFQKSGNRIIMIDILKYRVPWGWLGAWFDRIFLKRHLTQFLMHRNACIKIQAEKKASL
ncbi:MAG: SRPBCC family protein [Flavobacteriaceae bacterium]|nr:SRPBCC family protein [Flavobacteriaceae bacterium]